jgi:hypothetical protein
VTVAERRAYSNLAGHRLPVAKLEPLPIEDDAVADPANGALVPRCRTCGRPENAVSLNLFALFLGKRRAGTYRLCDACFYAANPIDPRSGDPLQAT